jgi:hypothetical protein
MARVIEVRVQGQLGEAMLRLLGWSHVTVPEQTIIRLDATPAGLQSLLRACTERGLAIERVHRMGGPVASPSPVPSRDPARDPDGPRRPSG